jgi:hypothetical protein
MGETPDRPVTYRRYQSCYRLPIFPFFVLVFVCSTVLYFAANPEHRQHLLTFRKDGTRQNEWSGYHAGPRAGKLRKCHAPHENVWQDLDETEFKDVLGFVSKNGAAVGIG